MRTQRSRSRLLFLAILALAACGGPRRYVHPGLDPATMKRVAVLPFENLSTDRVVGEKALRLLVLELLASGVYEVVESSYVQRILSERKIDNAGALTPDDLKRLGALLKADGLFLGTILDYSEPRGTAALTASLQLRLAEVGSGATVWSTKVSRSGTSLSKRLFGVGDVSSTDVLDDLIREALGTLYR